MALTLWDLNISGNALQADQERVPSGARETDVTVARLCCELAQFAAEAHSHEVSFG